MSFGEVSGSSNNVVPYDYSTSDDKSDSNNKAQGLMEILKLSHGGKPKCIVSLWD